MMAQKQTAEAAQRKPWQKRSPAEVMRHEVQKLRDDVAKKEEELTEAKRQLQNLEEAQKVIDRI
jgi:cell division protein FtsL